jgi:WD40 repeat protein
VNIDHSPDDEPDDESAQVRQVTGGGGPVDARHALSVQIGQDNVQINYIYKNPTLTDGVAPPPLVSVSGKVDSPYRGLSAFEEDDAPFFFGRDAAATEVLKRMSACTSGTGMLVVSGASGAGKSSLLRAGVLPRVRGAGLPAAPDAMSWPRVLLTPGPSPLGTLAVQVSRLAGADAAEIRRGLAADPGGFALTARQATSGHPGSGQSAGRRLLLVVDQFEQVFTQCPAEEERQAFIAALHAAATGHGPGQAPAALVVLAVRADFEARCANYPQLADAVQARYLLTPMTERQLRMAITEPARMTGSAVNADLVDVLLGEMSRRQPASSPVTTGPGLPTGAGLLPLLSHALDQAWRTRSGDTLSAADYDRVGGIEAAVASSAQRAFDRLTRPQQAIARQVFIRLTATTVDGVDTASRAYRSEFAEGRDEAGTRDVEAVLEAFAAERLLILGAGTVEISHEILLTAWPLLRDTWLAETHADRIVRTRLGVAAAEWERNGQDPSYLYRGSVLEAATVAIARSSAQPSRHAPLSKTDRDFVTASQRALMASQRAARRRVRTRRRAIAVLLALVVGLTAATIVAVRATRTANLQRDTAMSQQLASQVTGLERSDPNLARQISIAAYQTAQTPAAASSLFASQSLPGSISAPGVTGTAFGDDGQVLALIAGQRVRLWSMARHAFMATLPPGTLANCVAFSAADSGSLLAVGDGNGAVELWDVASPQHPVRLAATAATGGPVEQVTFSPDGRLLGSAGWDHTARLWGVTGSGRLESLAAVPAGGSVASSVALGRGDRLLVTGDWDHTVRLWDIADPRDPVSVAQIGGDQVVRSVALDPAGRVLAIGGDGSGASRPNVYLFSVAEPGDPQQLAGLQANGISIGALTFSPAEPALLAVGVGGGGQAYAWDVSNPSSPYIKPSSLTGGLSLALSPGGNLMATVGQSGNEVLLWNAVDSADPAAWAAIPTDTFDIPGQGDMDPDGRILAVTTGVSTQLWDIASAPHPALRAVLPGLVSTVALASAGRRVLLATGGNGWVTVWDVTTASHPEQLARVSVSRPGDAEENVEVALSPDGGTLAALEANETIQLWSLRDPGGLTALSELPSAPAGLLSFAPGGKAILDSASGSLTSAGPPGAALWDLRAPQRPVRVDGLPPLVSNSVAAALSPAAPMLATSDPSGIVRLWNVANLRHPALLATLSGNSAPQGELKFSPDGSVLVGHDSQHTVHEWDTSSPYATTIVGTTADNAWLSGISLPATPAGGRLLEVDSANGTDLLDLDPSAAVRRLCAGTGDLITAAQWGRYIPGLAYRNPCGTGGPRTAAPTSGGQVTAPPSAPPSFAAFAGSWYIHDGQLLISPSGHFSISVRTFRTCGQDPPPCDNMNSTSGLAGNGDRASGQLTSVSGAVASGDVTWTSDEVDTPKGRIDFTLNPQSDILTADGQNYCGQYAPGAACGA